MKASVIAGIVVAACLGFIIGHRCCKNRLVVPPIVKVDTLFIRDTIKAVEPKFVTKRVVDSIPYPVTDTIRMRDTLYILLERQQVTWEDSLARVYASGIDPVVDSVIHFTQDLFITKEIPVIQVKKTRWGIGVQAGYGAGKDGLTPYVGVGVSYNILAW